MYDATLRLRRYAITAEFKPKPAFALRLPRSTRIEAVRIAKHEKISLNHFVALAVAEKIARLELLNLEPLDSDKTELEEEDSRLLEEKLSRFRDSGAA